MNGVLRVQVRRYGEDCKDNEELSAEVVLRIDDTALP